MKNSKTPIDANIKPKKRICTLLPDHQIFHDLVNSLTFLPITRLDISISIGLVSVFMQAADSDPPFLRG